MTNNGVDASDARPKLRFKKLGNSELEVPNVCLGTMMFGSTNTEAEACDIMDYCLEQGINFFDTAELYSIPSTADNNGASERIVGRWMAARGCRERIILASKVSGPNPYGVTGRQYIVANRHEPPLDEAEPPRLDGKAIRQAVEGSLRRLQTSYLDLYQLHWPARYCPVFGARQYRPEREWEAASFEEQVAAVGQLIKEGKIRHWGLSNETTYGVCRMCEVAARLGVPPPVSIQNDFSLVCRSFDGELAEACAPRHYNISLLAYGCLAGGTLSGKYLDGQRPEGARHIVSPKFQARYHSDRTMAATADYAALARSKGLTPTQLALAWAAGRWYMASVIIGATSIEQARECIKACCMELDAATLEEVEKLYLKHGSSNTLD